MENKDVRKIGEYTKREDNPDSMYYPVDKLLNKKYQWFDVDKILSIDKDVKDKVLEHTHTRIFNLPKNCGKTVWMRERMNAHTRRVLEDDMMGRATQDRFVMICRSEEILKQRSYEINNSDKWDFYILGTKLLSKGIMIDRDEKTDKPIYKDRGIIVGSALLFNTMGNTSGHQYEGYVNAYYDEYRAKIKLPKGQKLIEATNYKIFLSNFQRGKKDIYVYLFGNNEPGPDMLAESFGIDKSIDYHIDLNRGVMYFNVPRAFYGKLDDVNNAAKRSANEDELMFIEENVALESNKSLVPRALFRDAKEWGYILYNDRFVKVYTKEDKWLIEFKSANQWKKDKDYMMTFGILTSDCVYDPMVQPASEDLIKFIMTMYRYNQLGFWEGECRTHMSEIWSIEVSKNYYRKLQE